MVALRASMGETRRASAADFRIIASVLLGVALLGTCSRAQAPPQPFTDKQVIRVLNKAATWYQSGMSQRESAATPQDISYADNARALSEQTLQLIFEFGHKSAEMLARQPGSPSQAGAVQSRYSSLVTEENGLAAEESKERTDIEHMEAVQATASSSARRTVIGTAIAEKQSALQLVRSRKEALEKFLKFAGGSAEPDGLESQIDALERAVPVPPGSVDKVARFAAATVNSRPVTSAEPAETGLWASVHKLFELYRKRQEINRALRTTDELSLALQQLQTPLRNQLDELIRRSEAVVGDGKMQNPKRAAVQKEALDLVNQEFKTSADALLPLVKSNLLLQAYKKTLTDWHDALKEDYSATLRSLVIGLAILAALSALVIVIFTLWRRAVLHYVSDLRRRYQLLLLRRVALWCVIGLLLAITLLSRLGSLATFAGLLSAGVAVALQSVFLAVIGYFLLIGKFGVKIGDQVQVSGVTGEVVDIGLLRLHVMEFAGEEPNAQPTGRSIAFSNSVVFQAAAGLFRQVPGARFLWREISLTFSPDTSFELVEDRIASVAKSVFESYKMELELIRSRLELELSSVSIAALEPTVRYSLTSGGIEARLRFPVLQKDVGAIDDRINRELLQAIRSKPELKTVRAEVTPMRINHNAG